MTDRNLKHFGIYIALVLLLLSAGQIAAQTGGQFSITVSVIGTGGGTSSNGSFTLTGTTGQAAAGSQPQGATFAAFNGFWTPASGPTAATVGIKGRVFGDGSAGLRGALVVMTDMNGQTRRNQTGSFGFFNFENVEVGQIYIITVFSKNFHFAPQIVSVFEEMNDLYFIPINQEPQK